MIGGSAQSPTFGCDASLKPSNCCVKRAYGEKAQCATDVPPSILVEANLTRATGGPFSGNGKETTHRCLKCLSWIARNGPWSRSIREALATCLPRGKQRSIGAFPSP